MRLTDHPQLLALLLATATVTACSSNDTPPDDTAPTLVAATFTDASTIRLTFSEPIADPSAVNTDAFRLSIGVKDVASTVYYALDYDGLYVDDDSGGDEGPITDGDPTADPTIVDPTDATGDDTTSDPTTDATTDDPTDPSGDTYDPSDSYDPTTDPTADPSGYEEGGYVTPTAALPGDLTRPIPTHTFADLDIASVVLAADSKQIELRLAAPVTDTFACDALADLAAESTKLGIFVHYKPGSTTITDTAGNPLAAIAPHWVDARANAYAELQGDFPHLNPYLPIACP